MPEDVLTREFAEKRAELISDVSYKLRIFLKKNSKTYKGQCEIKFFLKQVDGYLKVDFIGSNIKMVVVNGQIANYKKEEFAILIQEKYLNEGQNMVEVEYENQYDYTGTGLHHFVDPEDKREYLYTHFEPYDAHRVFPCFDQPDLKATYELTVEHPEEWVIVSNSPEKKILIRGKTKTTEFEKTKSFSTYLFCICAGEFHFVEDAFGNIPLRLLCRQSMKPYLREKENFLTTKQGLEFYQKFFDFPYPFEKYDQIFVPEFNHGAMENVGAVTFSEHLLYRYEPTRTERSRTADVILHEMVHMWFGDLVTMKWWDDLWLNESFADFLSYLGLVMATEFKEGWQSFYARKAWAYVEDQWTTTHPIAADARDTDTAFTNFDGISYSKGAAILKQLMFFIGEESFKKGLANYFKKYQWKNTKLSDFLKCMEDASNKNLENWSKMWIETTGLNAIEPIIKFDNKKIKSFSIKQLPSLKNNLLREHRCQIALFSKGKKQKELSVVYGGPITEINEFANEKKPEMVFLNYNDYDYVKEILDGGSLEYSMKNLDKIKEDLPRQMIYGNLWQMVRDALLDPRKYIELVIENGPKEKNLFILESLLRRSAAILGSYVNDKDYCEYSQKLFDLSWNVINKKIGKDFKDIWFSLVLASSAGSKNPEKLAGLISGKIKINDFVFNQEERWDAIIRLAVAGSRNIDQLISNELKKDASDIGQKEAFSANVAKPENKIEHWKLFVKGEGQSLDYLRSGMRTFFSRKQKEQLREFSEMFFEEIGKIFNEKNRKYAEDFFESLFPAIYVEREMAEKCRKYLENNPSAPTILKENLLESLDELERSLKILGKFGK